MADTKEAQDSHARLRDTDLSDLIRDAILTGVYVPGQRMVEVDLCEEFGASRFMVRAALKELAGEGLIEIPRNKGARVRPVPLDESIEIVEVRMALEGISAARAARNANEDDIRDLRQIVEGMEQSIKNGDLAAYMRTNVDFHRTIQRISANTTCTRILERLRALVVRHQFALSDQPRYPSVPVAQHERIVEAIAKHDSQAAEAAMREHIATIIAAMQDMKTHP